MAKKLTTAAHQALVREIAAQIAAEGLSVADQHPIPYAIKLSLIGGGIVTVYNGKAGPSAVLGGRFTEAERERIEAVLAGRGLLRGGTTAVAKPSLAAESEPAAEPEDAEPVADDGELKASPQNLAGVAGIRIGTDESGKGDYFGPLVVAGVKIHHSMEGKLLAAGIQDSKLIAGHRHAITLSGWIESELPCSVQVLMPEEYNRTYGGNLNVLLARLHAKVIAELAEDGEAVVAVVDQFATSVVLQREVRALGCGIRILARHRAESDVAVGAASIVARGRYLIALRELSNEWAVKLSAGAGDPVLRNGAEMVRLYGPESLGKVGKLHFKTTEQILIRAGVKRP